MRDRWRNWSGELQTTPRRLYCDDAGGRWKSPRTLEDLQAIVRDARVEQVSVRVFGSSHSWAALVPNDGGYVVDNRMINSSDGYYNASITPARDGRKARATVPPGLLSSEFEEWLWTMGYTLPASAFEDCFTLGGMAATATHGTGIDIGTVSDMVVGMTFVDGHGEVRRWDRDSCSADELAAIQCGLGCLGLIYDITFEVEPRYEALHIAKLIRYEDYFADTDHARANLRELHETHTSIEFFWWPFRFRRLPLLADMEINPEVFVLATRKQVPSDARPRGLLRRFMHLEVFDMLAMICAGTAMRAVSHVPRLAFMQAWYGCFSMLWVSARSGAYRMPQYDANHFVNATAVEFTSAMASEWSVPFRRDAPIDADDGYERVRQSFALLHDLVVEAFETYPRHDARATPTCLGSAEIGLGLGLSYGSRSLCLASGAGGFASLLATGASGLEALVSERPDLGLAAGELVGRRDIADGAVQAVVVVMVDEALDHVPRLFERAGRVGPDRVDLQRLVDPLELAVGLRVIRRGSDVGHAAQPNEVAEIAGNELRAVVGDQPRGHAGEALTGPLQDDLDVGLLHRLAQLPMHDIATIPVEHQAQVVESAGDVDIRDVGMPVLVRPLRLIKPVPFAEGLRLQRSSRPTALSTL